MKIQVEVQGPQWVTRSPRRAKRLAVAMVAILVLGIPAAVWASHDFSDVLTSDQFHTQISAIKGAGITTGCSATTYCPTEFVRRDAMAAFMHRGYGRVAFADSGTYVNLADAAEHDLTTVTINTGGAPGGTGFLKVEGTGHAFQNAGQTTGPVRLRLWVARPATSQASISAYETLMPTAAGQPNPNGAAAVTWVFAVPTATAVTIHLKGQLDWGSGQMSAWGQLTATYIPFGSTGGSTLGAGAATPAKEGTVNQP